MTTAQLSRKMSKLGSKGGKATKRRKGKKFFSKISKMRKVFGGGRKPSVKPEIDASIIDD